MKTARQLAWEGLKAVLLEGRSLSAILPELLAQCETRDRALLQKLLLGVLRWRESLRALLSPLLKKPLKSRDADIELLLLLGLYQLHYMDAIPAHAAVNETIRLLPRRKQWARGLINAVLRNFSRTDATTRQQWLACCERARFSHPDWLIEQIRSDWPDAWPSILTANNTTPPLTLRINPLKIARDDFLALPELKPCEPEPHPASPTGILLRQSVDVRTLPGFDGGWFSVQDAAAQQAGFLLAPQPGERILDACAAPGGKTSHLLELSSNQAHVLALEKDPRRLQRLQENLARLDLHAQLRQGDASQPEDWWDGDPFDKILLDAPCSATGIIRRHPDIKWHRTPQDITQLRHTQAAILDALWPLLRPGGTLLYATCSVLADENRNQMTAFIQRHADVEEVPLPPHTFWTAQPVGGAILPGTEDMDGFYYACLRKQNKTF